MDLNPIIISHDLIPPASSIAFFKSVSADYQPSKLAQTAVYKVTERVGEEGASGTWRGGWAKRFIPDTLTYETSMESKEDGMRSITNAPMGVHSVTTWLVKDSEEEGAGLILEKMGLVTSNKMLMGFIRTTINESYEKLATEFVALLEKEYADGNGGEEKVEE